MDSITQGLLGAVTAQLGFRDKLGRSATWIAAGAAVLPDLDVFTVPAMHYLGIEPGPFASLKYHRGITHSLIAIPFFSAAVAGLWWLIRRKQFGWLYLCVLVAMLSHPLLDWCTSYGTPLLYPLVQRRFAIDAAPIVDLFYTPLLILTLLTCWIVRRWTGLASRRALLAGWIGFALSCGYLATGYALHHVAMNRALAAYAAMPQAAPSQAKANSYPGLGSIFAWRVTVETPSTWYVGRTNLLYNQPVELAEAPAYDGPAVERALQREEVQIFDWFAMGQLRAVVRHEDGLTVVEFHDMRYGQSLESPESMWCARVDLDSQGQVVDVRRERGFRARGRGPMLIRFVRTAWGEMFKP